MGSASFFERLVEAASIIARHAEYSGKEQVVEQGFEDIERLWLSGQITAEQYVVLREMLLHPCSLSTA